MSEKQVTRIKVGEVSVGIIGLREVLEQMVNGHANQSDAAIQVHMLEQLGRKNYIPARAREEYGRAFLREFRKMMGQPCDEESSGELEIKILGPGCPQCDQLEKTVMELLSELNQPAHLEHVRDMQEIAGYGIMTTPALLINGRVLAKGAVPAKAKMKKWLMAAKP
jgi:small redox-active disulfide protein 2